MGTTGDPVKAAVYHKPYTRLSLEDWETPAPGPKSVRIRVKACGICHMDLRYIDHGVMPLKEPPVILGHEITGVVDETGENAEDIGPGTRVLVPSVIPCLSCEYCQDARTNLCHDRILPGNQIDGGYAEYMIVPKEGIIPLPDEIPLEEGSVLAGAFAVSHHALTNVGRLQPDEVLLVYGCGGLGSAAIQVGKRIGAYVIGMDLNPVKLQWAREMGADETVNSHGIRDLGQHISDLTGGGVDVALEAIGAPRTMFQSFSCLQPSGRAVILGYTENYAKFPAAHLVMEERQIYGVFGCPIREYPNIFEYTVNGVYHPDRLVTKKIPLEEIEEGLNSVRSGGTLRTIVIP